MSAVTTLKDPRRYFEEIGADRSAVAEQPPVCLYLEVTNRCNLLCETCPRTFEELEPPADMSWDLFTKIVDQVPNVARVVMHGVGEPMLVKNLPDMIRYTAMNFRIPSADYAKRYADNNTVVRQQVTLPNIIAIPGGLPIKVGNEVVGGVGASGSQGVDEPCVQAGLDKVADQLK